MQPFVISARNQKLLDTVGSHATIAELEAAARDNLSFTDASNAPEEAPKHPVIDSSNLIHDFKTDNDRRSFMGKLVATKEYFVNIKQKRYRRGLSLLTGKKSPNKKISDNPTD